MSSQDSDPITPVAFMTHHDEPMLFPTWDEAVQYCDDDESPIPLFHADDVAKLQTENEALKAQLAAMTQERDQWKQLAANCELAEEQVSSSYQLAASQAREQQLREALEICKKEMQGDKWDALYIDGVLASK